MFASPRPRSYSAETYLKGIFFLVHAMEAYRGSGGTSPYILKLGTIWQWAFSFTSRKELRYLLDRRLDGTQAPFPRFGEENFLLSPSGFEPRSSSPCICYLSTQFWHTMNCTTWHHVIFHRTVPSVYAYTCQNAGYYQQRGFPERVCGWMQIKFSCFFNASWSYVMLANKMHIFPPASLLAKTHGKPTI
jgi:hypothetical protein